MQRLGILFEPVSEKDIHRDWNDLSQKDKRVHRVSRRTLLFHVACLADVNECSLDWLPKTCDRNEYFDFLYDIFELEISPILGTEFDPAAHTGLKFKSIHLKVLENSEGNGRGESSSALAWWHTIEKATVSDLRRRKLYQAPLFMDLDRAFLSIQSSSASAERLFSDSGSYVVSNRQHTDSSIEEMLLMIRSYVQDRVRASNGQNSFLVGKHRSLGTSRKKLLQK